MTANALTAALLIEIPRKFPGARVWRANTGTGYGADSVRGAIACLQVGNIKGALDYLRRRPITFGVVGQADISGILPGGRRLEIEIKAGRDKMSEQQKAFCVMIRGVGGVYIEARDVETTLAEIGDAT